MQYSSINKSSFPGIYVIYPVFNSKQDTAFQQEKKLQLAVSVRGDAVSDIVVDVSVVGGKIK